MHDPMTVAFEIRWPFSRKEHKPRIATIWHVDPERDGTDDSCGWFIRPRHGSKDVLDLIIQRYEFDWDGVFKSETNRTYLCGLFAPNGEPHFSVPGVVLNLFFLAAGVIFESDGHTNWRKAGRFIQKHLADILLFAENVTDSLHDGITRKYEIACGEKYDKRSRDARIRQLAGCIYSWILRAERPWYRHPRWHIHHWKIQVHAVVNFKRWAFSRCERCGKRFQWGESVCTASWNGTGPKWFRSEPDVYHSSCMGQSGRLLQESPPADA